MDLSQETLIAKTHLSYKNQSQVPGTSRSGRSCTFAWLQTCPAWKRGRSVQVNSWLVNSAFENKKSTIKEIYTRPTFECFQVGQFKTIQCWRGHSCGTSTFYLPPIAKVIFWHWDDQHVSYVVLPECWWSGIWKREVKKSLLMPFFSLIIGWVHLTLLFIINDKLLKFKLFFFMNIVLQDLCTSGHWDCGSGWLASTWKEKQRKAKIGKTPGTTNQVSCCKFQWLPSVWQMWGDSQLSIYGRSCWEIQTKGRRTCTSKVNISTFCKRLLRFF